MKLTPVIERPNFLKNNHFRIILAFLFEIKAVRLSNISLHAVRRLLKIFRFTRPKNFFEIRKFYTVAVFETH